MRTTRKRAIERARHLTRMGTIEVGDIVEVVANSYYGHKVGTIGTVAAIKYDGDFVDIYVSVYMGLIDHNYVLIHKHTDLKVIKKGSN